MPALIWGAGVGCEEENYQRDFHDPFSCVEPCLHNAPIYRQTWTRTAPAPNRPVKHGTPKVFTKPNPSLKHWWNGHSSPSDRRTTRGTSATQPTNEGRARAGGKPRRPRRADMTRRQASRFHGTRASAGHQDRHDSVTPAVIRRERADGTPRPGVIKTESSGSVITKITEPLGGL